MARARVPSTAALRHLRAARVDHEVLPYAYVDGGGARAAATALNLDLHSVIKTLVFEDGDGEPLIVLMHGDRGVSSRALARALRVKSAAPCAPATAERLTGYRVGGTSPFGLRRPLPVYVQRSILALDRIAINAGSRGVLVMLQPQVLVEQLGATLVDVARPPTGRRPG